MHLEINCYLYTRGLDYSGNDITSRLDVLCLSIAVSTRSLRDLARVFTTQKIQDNNM